MAGSLRCVPYVLVAAVIAITAACLGDDKRGASAATPRNRSWIQPMARSDWSSCAAVRRHRTPYAGCGKCIAEAGHVAHEDAQLSVQANLMEKDTVWRAMPQAYRDAEDDLAEWLKAPVLRTGRAPTLGGSNPSLSVLSGREEP